MILFSSYLDKEKQCNNYETNIQRPEFAPKNSKMWRMQKKRKLQKWMVKDIKEDPISDRMFLLFQSFLLIPPFSVPFII